MFPLSSSNKPAKQWYHSFDSKQILQGNLEPISALYFLQSKTHSGVRDYIINRLYDYELVDIDFILPQLCHLYSIWPQAAAQRIGELLIYKCSMSVDLTLKAIWILSASQYHVGVCNNLQERANRIGELMDEIEMALVNGKLVIHQNRHSNADNITPSTTIRTTSSTGTNVNGGLGMNGKKESHGDISKISLRDRSTSQPKSLAAPSSTGGIKRVASIPSLRRRSTSGRNLISRPTTPEQPQQTSSRLDPIDNTNESSSSSSSAAMTPPLHPQLASDRRSSNGGAEIGSGNNKVAENNNNTKNNKTDLRGNVVNAVRKSVDGVTHSLDELHIAQSGGTASNESLTSNLTSSSFTTATTTTNSASSISISPSPGSSFSPSSTAALLESSELISVLSKQIRKDYLHLILAMVQNLIKVSHILVRYPIDERKQHLKKYIRILDEKCVRGLYFPQSTDDHRHYKLVRLLPDDCHALKSRDKAPFLMFFETVNTHMSVFDSETFTAYKTYEDVMHSMMTNGIVDNELETMDIADAANIPNHSTMQSISYQDADVKLAKPYINKRNSSNAQPQPSPHRASNPSAHPLPSRDNPTAYPPTHPTAYPPPAAAAPGQIAATNTTHRSRASSLANPHGHGHVQQHTTKDVEKAIISAAKRDTFTTSTAPKGNNALAVAKPMMHSGSVPSKLNLLTAGEDSKSDSSQATRRNDRSVEPSSVGKKLASPKSYSDDSSESASSIALPTHGIHAHSGSERSNAQEVAGKAVNIDVAPNTLTTLFRQPSASASSSPISSTQPAIHLKRDGYITITPPENVSPSSAIKQENRTSASTDDTLPHSQSQSLPKPLESTVPPSQSMSHTQFKLTHSNTDSKLSNKGPSTSGSGKVKNNRLTDTLSIHQMKQQYMLRNGKAYINHLTIDPQTMKEHMSNSAGTSPNPYNAIHSSHQALQFSESYGLYNAFGESWAARRQRIRQISPYGNQDGWDIRSVIFKAGDDCRQETLAIQLICALHHIWQEASLPLYVHPYSVLITSPTSGLIETIADAISIDSLKKNVAITTKQGWKSLADFFVDHFLKGIDGSAAQYETAVRNFAESMAGYSLVQWLLSVKDRHNGNILLTRQGHVVHIDYGFMLTNSPGGNWGFESAPFKLTSEFVEVLGGDASEMFGYYKILVIRGFLEARKNAHKLIALVECMIDQSRMACFIGGYQATINGLATRFALNLTDEQAVEFAVSLIDQSLLNWRTVQYDNYQRITNNIE